jgi:hypothetical protein
MNTTAGSFSLLGSVDFCGIQYLTTTMQGRLIYPNFPILEENLLLDGQEEVANVRTPITPTPTPVALLLVLE